MIESIQPGIVTKDGTTIYPTGLEWLIAFAIKGCQWAIDECERLNIPVLLKDYEALIWRGDGI